MTFEELYIKAKRLGAMSMYGEKKKFLWRGLTFCEDGTVCSSTSGSMYSKHKNADQMLQIMEALK